jgi:hypothetical protein
MRTLMVFALCVLFTGMCAAVVTHETITYATSVNRISGTVVGYGNLNPGVKVEVSAKPEVWADDALSLRLFDFDSSATISGRKLVCTSKGVSEPWSCGAK